MSDGPDPPYKHVTSKVLEGSNLLGVTIPKDSTFDFGEIRNILEQDTHSYLSGVRNTDVDWFLRDSSISTDVKGRGLPLEQSESEQTVSSEKDDADTSSSSISQVHLNTNISNSNDRISTKTRASIAPIQEENVASSPPVTPRQPADALARRRRASSVSSVTSNGSSGSTGSSGGFFSKLKGKLGHKDTPPPTNQLSPQQQAPAAKTTPVFKANYDMNLRKTASNQSSPGPEPIDKLLLRRTPTAPTHSEDTSDPRLDEYIKFFKQKNARRNSLAACLFPPTAKPTPAGIPSHPEFSPLPSALLNGFENVTYHKTSTPATAPAAPVPDPLTTTKISSIFRRKSVSGPLPGASAPRQSTESTASIRSGASNSPPPVADVHPSFKELKPLKRVAFHLSTFLIDPPQQIPSRTPRRGNVEVLPNGVVRINPLTELDKAAIEKSQLGQGGGIVVGGTGALGLVKKPPKEPEIGETDKEEPESDDADDDKENSNSKDDEEDTAVDKHARLLAIDKPMISHQVHSYTTPVKKMALDLMYTRCCHLREILPIPAIVKQIPKGSMAPLPILQLRNPTPTLIEVQTFADFIRIAPIMCVSLDGVSLTLEQFKIILSAMSAKQQLEKLSLRNTAIDHEGWSLLSWFLSRNTVLNRLDITQCPSLSVNVLKKKKKKDDPKKAEEPSRMVCNKENRSDMDWSLFVATLVARGGIEELILTGCCITDSDIFEKLMKLAVLKKTTRLGLAYNQLTPKHFKIIVDNWLFQDFARGLDLGYNDFLSGKMLKILLDAKKVPGFERKLNKCSLTFLSLNSTNIRFTEYFKETFESILMKFPNLKYLDFSNNQKLFGTNIKAKSLDEQGDTSGSSDSKPSSSESSIASPEHNDLDLSENAIISYVTSKLPMFPCLVRLHLENNNFSDDSLLSIAKVIPFCKHLGYLSLVGNKMDLTSSSAMIQALKNSKSLINLDCDYDDFPDFFKDKIGLYTMRNMERLLYLPNKDKTGLITDEKDSNHESLTEQLNTILEMKAAHTLDLASPVVTKFLLRALKIRHELKEAINELLKLQLKNELNLEGKETLIRFIFIDSSIEKGLQLIDNSLVSDETIHPNMLLLGAEDEKNKYQLYTGDTVTSDDGKLDIPRAPDIPPSVSPLAVSRSASKSNLSSLERQEGSVLKLLKLHDFHHSGDHETKFLKTLGGLSGDEIRQKLMGVEFSDLDKIIGYLDKLKEHGLSLDTMFNCNGNVDATYLKQLEEDALNISEIQKKLQQLTEKSDSFLSLDASEIKQHEHAALSETTKHTGDGDGDAAMGKAYDKVLSNLRK